MLEKTVEVLRPKPASEIGLALARRHSERVAPAQIGEPGEVGVCRHQLTTVLDRKGSEVGIGPRRSFDHAPRWALSCVHLQQAISYSCARRFAVYRTGRSIKQACEEIGERLVRLSGMRCASTHE